MITGISNILKQDIFARIFFRECKTYSKNLQKCRRFLTLVYWVN